MHQIRLYIQIMWEIIYCCAHERLVDLQQVDTTSSFECAHHAGLNVGEHKLTDSAVSTSVIALI